MSSTSLVPCPACSQRRDLIAIKRDPEGMGEIRTFRCAACDETMRYLFRGRGEPINLANKSPHA